MMESQFRKKYSRYSDKELICRIIVVPHDEEAATYLLYIRYAPLLKKLYRKVFNNNNIWYEDCRNDLFVFLKGKDGEWNKLRTFEWKSSFGAWLDRTAYNRFLVIKPVLIGKIENPFYIDDGERKSNMEIPDAGEQDFAARELKVLLMEAIGLLKDPDQKFVVLKRLQGYNSKEIARLMQLRWEKHGIVKYNNKNQQVIPDAAYVDVRMQRAKDNLGNILKTLM